MNRKWNPEKKKNMILPADCAPEDLSRSPKVDGAMRRLGVHALTQEPHVLHLLPHQATRDANLLAPYNHDFLAVQEFLCYDRRKPTKHVVPCIHHYSLGAYP